MRTENVGEGGHAGLLLRIDGNEGSLAFDNMQSRGITGTNDWQQYSIELPYPDGAQLIFVAGIMVGTGEVWFDDFELTLDGVPIHEAKEAVPVLLPAQLDTAFTNGPGIEITGLADEQVQRLYVLGKVWGFVKYYHPNIVAGNVNWDNQLFRVLHTFIKAREDEEFQDLMLEWVRIVGEVPDNGGNTYESTNDTKLDPEVGWIADTDMLGDQLSGLLTRLRAADRPTDNFYVGFARNVGNPQFKHERKYANMSFDDDGVKLLGLYRYWNMIEYFFPYRHLMDEDWDEVLLSFIPRLIEADDELSYKLVLLELIGKVQDTHANIWQIDPLLTDYFGPNAAPFEVRHVEDQIVVTRIFEESAYDAGIELGDIIIEIDNVPVGDRIASLKPHCPASNDPTQMRDVCRKLLRTSKENITVSILGKGELSFPADASQRANYRRMDVESHMKLAGNIGYIYPGSLGRGTIGEIMDGFEETDGLIVDLRCYPSDFIVFSLGERLMPSPTEFVKFTSGSKQHPGAFNFGTTLSVGRENTEYYQGPVVILINETTQSQAEYTTMALRVAPDATVIGSTTAGADGNVSEIFLPGGVRTMISGIGVYYPDGTETQRIGIVPDIEMRPTIAGIREGRDELLEAAIKLIQE